ncbi:M23 family metallopeptidase [Chakrabartyella piscis]|uniref:M23 family metallopeptidase n=1 Tax=Chakrabartyella piscis TaxID=2918914 RepID=UPI0029586362|nr:M23 family metallopeptidase [Chakrabartyella piscis]
MKKANLPVMMTIGTCFCVMAVGAGVMFQEAKVEDIPETTEQQRIIIEKEDVAIPQTSQAVTSTQTESLDTEAVEGVEEVDATTTTALASDPLAFVFPVDGDVVMTYSVETAIFDPTLAQYRTNDSISLSAAVGTEVYASETGVVKEIQKDEQRGTSLVVAHADGWLTTYSQLAADISVSVGETVSKGQKLGTVGEPTKYTIALGEHLEFAMEQDGVSQNPEAVATK